MLIAHEDWASCQTKVGSPIDYFFRKDGSWLSVLKAELDAVHSNVSPAWADLDDIEEQRRNNTTLPLPDSANSDALSQPALPSIPRHFLRQAVAGVGLPAPPGAPQHAAIWRESLSSSPPR